jgi:hypothetical protein
VHLPNKNLFSCVVPSFCEVVGCAVLLCSDHFITVSAEISFVIGRYFSEHRFTT